MHLDRTGGREAHQLAGTQGCLVLLVTVSKSRRCSAAPPGQLDGHSLHKEDGRAHSLSLCKESHLLSAIRRNLTLLLPQWISTQENIEADFLSRHRLQRCDFKLAPSEIRKIFRRLQIWPILEAFVSSGSYQIPRNMTWEQDSRAMAINALDYYWDPETWIFPLVPPHFSSTGGCSRAADHGDSDLSGVEGRNMVASVD